MNLRTLRNLWLVLLAIPLLFVSPAHSEVDRAELHQAVLDLTSPWTVMCVAAHPDDEDGSTLTVLRRKYGMHTISLFSTFGEGGQNAVVPSLNENPGGILPNKRLPAPECKASNQTSLASANLVFSSLPKE